MRSASLLIVLFLSAYLPSFADEIKDPYYECVRALGSAAEELVKRDYKDNPPLGVVPIAALDDLGCKEKEVMANVAIKIRLEGNVEKFGLFHLHATRDGKLASVAVEKPWTVFTDMSEFKIAWCKLMNWRQKSLEEQGCVYPPKNNPSRHKHGTKTQ